MRSMSPTPALPVDDVDGVRPRHITTGSDDAADDGAQPDDMRW